jgi:hypothetical protein
VYFPISRFISLLCHTKLAAALEVGLIGSEGMLGGTLLLGVGHSPVTALVQGTGTSPRLKAGDFLRIAAQSPALDAVARKCLYVYPRPVAGSRPKLAIDSWGAADADFEE